MANKHRGDVDIEIGGKTFTINFNWQALAELETGLGDNYVQTIMDGLTGMSAKVVMACLVAGLKKHHPGYASVEILGQYDEPPAMLADPIFRALGLGLWGSEDFFTETAKRVEEAEHDIEAERKRIADMGGDEDAADPTEAEPAKA